MKIVEGEFEVEMAFWGEYTKKGFANKFNIFKSIKRIIFLIGKFSFLSAVKPWNWAGNLQPNVKLMAIYLTKNQKKAINDWLVYEEDYISVSNGLSSDFQIPWGRFSWYCIKNIFKVYSEIIKNKKTDIYMPWFEDFVRYAAGKEIAIELFQLVKPSFLLFSNDHSGVSRGINKVAKEMGIKLIYTQHACVGKGFPPLSFDLSMLDGLQSFELYSKSGKNFGKIILTGRHKNVLINQNFNMKRRKVIGLATNGLDNINVWRNIILTLKRADYDLVLRCHPAEKRRRKWMKLTQKYGIRIQEDNLHEFISKIDLLVAGVTGTILDASIAGVPTVCFLDKKNNPYANNDYYKYSELGVCVDCDSVDSLKQCIEIAFDKGVSQKAVLMFDVGLLLDPILIKNKIIKKFMQDDRREQPIDYFPGYELFRHDNYGEFYAPINYIELINNNGTEKEYQFDVQYSLG